MIHIHYFKSQTNCNFNKIFLVKRNLVSVIKPLVWNLRNEITNVLIMYVDSSTILYNNVYDIEPLNNYIINKKEIDESTI